MRRCVRDALLAEQSGLCAYCNQRVTAEPGDHHIEHLLPRHLVADDELTPLATSRIEASGIPRERLDIDYRNLLVCCPNQEGRTGRKGCGDHKSGQLLPLTPLESGCEAALVYLLTGMVRSPLKDGQRAIEVLGLDRVELRHGRKLALEGLLEIVAEIETMLPSERHAGHLHRLTEADDQGRLPEFVIALRQLTDALDLP